MVSSVSLMFFLQYQFLCILRSYVFIVILVASLFHTVHVLMFNLLSSSGNVATAGWCHNLFPTDKLLSFVFFYLHCTHVAYFFLFYWVSWSKYYHLFCSGLDGTRTTQRGSRNGDVHHHFGIRRDGQLSYHQKTSAAEKKTWSSWCHVVFGKGILSTQCCSF